VSQARFQKQQREKARRERAAAKWARKEERREQKAEPTAATSSDDQAALLADLATLHERFDKGELELDDFLAAKDDLTQRLAVD